MKQINKGYLGLLFVGTLLLSCRGEGEGKQKYTATEQQHTAVQVGAATAKYVYPTLIPQKKGWWLGGATIGKQVYSPQSVVPAVGCDTVYADWATVLAKEKSIEVLMLPNTSGVERTISIGISQGNTGGSLKVTQEP